jgi:hypothetical protein
MKELNIVHYYHSNSIPLYNIMDCSEKEAHELANKLALNEGKAFNRFKYFNDYYSTRIKVERWLHEWFKILGGEPKIEHPLYFVLEGNDYLKKCYGEEKAIKISLKKIIPKHISFTFGDSMAIFYENDTYKKSPFLMESLYKMINGYKNGIDEYFKMIEKEYHYIECQLWTKEYYYD